MAKMFVIKLPPLKVKRTYDQQEVVDNKMVTRTIEEPVRELDKKILETLFTLAAATKKTISDALQCQDCIDQIKNLGDKENIIKFTEADIKYLGEGFELTAGLDEYGRMRRPTVWLSERKELLEQIKTPLTEEDWLKAQKPEKDKKER